MKLLAAATGSALVPAIDGDALGMPKPSGQMADSQFRVHAKAYALTPVFSRLRMGDVKPAGWIREQMRRDLNVGFAGRLNELCHEASTDIFASGRNTPRHMGTVLRAGDNQPTDASSGFAWWNGETEGNWRAGFVMLAYLAQDEAYMHKADAWVQHVLSFQDEDGYLGIYAPELRYKHEGEWWTQACLLRGLLAYAELTKNADVLRAVRRSIDNTITVFQQGKTTPPWLTGPKKGPTESHDLMISDVLERLFELTGDVRYRDFAVWMYDRWSNIDSDSQMTNGHSDDSLPFLLDREKPLIAHGVHTVENMRLPLWLWMATGRDDFGKAIRNGLDKLQRYSMPGGSIVSAELVENKPPDPNKAEFEYCVTKETLFTYESALQKVGLAAHAERIERVFFNDAQGSRLPDGTAITYLTAENQPRLNGRTPNGSDPEPRNKFSPAHADVAVCCNPMSTQIAALYVQGMWMQHRDGGLAALLYGPCEVNTIVDGVPVELKERTVYPFEHRVEVSIHPARPVEFSIYFRDPEWSRGTKLMSAGARIQREGDFWKVTKQWKGEERITLTFVAEVRQMEAVNGEIALQYGALLYAMPIAYKRTVIKQYSVAGFEDTYYEPAHDGLDDLALLSDSRWTGFSFKPVSRGDAVSTLRPFDKAVVSLQGPMMHVKTGLMANVELIPLGNAPVLRRLTFPVTP